MALLDAKYKLDIEAAERTNSSTAAIEAQYAVNKKALTEQRAKDEKTFMVQTAQEATSAIFSIMASSRQAKLDAEL